MVDARFSGNHLGYHDVCGHGANDRDDNARCHGDDRCASDLSDRENRVSVRRESVLHGNVHDGHDQRPSNRQC